jgi:hypothetical protein
MFYNPIELELWKTFVASAERKALFNYQTRDLKSPEAQMLARLLRGVCLLFNVRRLQSFRLLHYSVQQD